jgi:CO/xanthine dehydrogenase FAD-binding subunit
LQAGAPPWEARAIRICWKNYHTPETVDAAIDLLSHYDGRALVIGGGTDLLLEIQQGLRPPAHAMVDTSRIARLNRITTEEGYIVIGCAVTHSQIIQDQGITQHGTCLVEACGVIGGPQVRNVGTLAGNVAHALPAGDGSIALLALDGEIEIADSMGSRWMPLQMAFLGPGKSVIDHHRTLLTRLRFRPAGALEASAFHRIMRPQGVALPIIAMAARLQLDHHNHISSVRISVGPAGPVPCLAETAMESLIGAAPSTERFSQATEAALQQISLRSSQYRATRKYREEMIRTHLPRVLARSAERAVSGHAVPVGVGQ